MAGPDEPASSRFSTAAQVISLVKEGLLAIAIAIGGLWALFRYDYIESSSAKIRYELDLAKSKSQVILTLRIEEQIKKENGKYIIFGRFFIKNEGTRDTLVKCGATEGGSPPVTLYRLDTTKAGPIPVQNSMITSVFYDENGQVQTDISLDASRETSVPFAVTVAEPGLYMLNLQVPVRPEDIGEIERDVGTDWSWSEQKLVYLD